ncbi:MAG: 3-oxoacyl-[acyl-carrier-protein] reductase [Dehalococcoidaceae bacterium]|nr:3-oxoacyl-[acyl-carrier-protein] reductase [Dehalococcoidaceae bacterium]
MNKDFFLKDKNAIVSGGSRGIGRAISSSFVQLGASVTIVYKSNKQEAESLVDELNKYKDQIQIVQGDISNEVDVNNIIEQSRNKFGDLHILVNNAGITSDTLLVRMKQEDWSKVIDINLTGTFNMTKAVMRGMIKNKYGRIINISSVVGEIGNLGQSNYSAAKAGIIGFTKSIAREVATRGITVNAVAPGFVETEMTNDLSDEQKELILNAIPMNRYAATNDIAGAVCFLASDNASYITGQTLNVDGGLVMH